LARGARTGVRSTLSGVLNNYIRLDVGILTDINVQDPSKPTEFVETIEIKANISFGEVIVVDKSHLSQDERRLRDAFRLALIGILVALRHQAW
jgi:hypothetical protein